MNYMVCRLYVFIAAIVFTGSAWSASAPNIIMIVVDDMRIDEYGAGGHPYLSTPNIDRIAREGATFSRAYHATPLCSPNRASILTGQYSSRHGILDNTSRSYASHKLELFPQQLQKSGYKTAHVGKWHMGNDASPRPGYDYWVSFQGQGRSKNPILYENGKLGEVKGYITDIFTDRAVSFIRRESQSPFFLYIGHKAVHPDSRQLDDGNVDINYGSRFIPADRHKGSYDKKFVERRPNHGFSREDSKGKPVLSRALEFKNSAEIQRRFGKLIGDDVSESSIRRRAEMIRSVDEGLGRIFETLEQRNILENTLVVLTTDNGYFYGEHGLTVERRLPYEEAIRAPLLMRYPKLIPSGVTIDGFASSVDLAPTVLDIAGVEIPRSVQGVSLKPQLKPGGNSVRDRVLVEYHGHENPMPWTAKLDYRAILKGNYKYIKWLRYDGEAELYDLSADPYEQHNLIADKPSQAVLADLKHELDQLVLKSMGM